MNFEYKKQPNILHLLRILNFFQINYKFINVNLTIFTIFVFPIITTPDNEE